jgi:hypothetical protein
MDRLTGVGEGMMESVLEGISPQAIEQMSVNLGRARENLRGATAKRAAGKAASAA